MSWLALALWVLAIVVVLLSGAYVYFCIWQKPNVLEQLGVGQFYPNKHLPVAKIDSYFELKERLRAEHCKTSKDDGDLWMSKLPCQAKDMIKYRLMQRTIGDVFAYQKIDTDARGYWLLFSKGVITKQFWNSVVEAQRELSQELEAVKAEALRIEPQQDPQGMINEAMQFVVRYGDKMPSANDVAKHADVMADMMKNLPPPGHPAAAAVAAAAAASMGQRALGPNGVQPLVPQAPQPVASSGGVGDGCKWQQDADEFEVVVNVPSTSTKADIKVIIQSRSINILVKGVSFLEGSLAGTCRPEGSTWTLNKGRLVLSLEKASAKAWPDLFMAPKK